jgi:hypothetical protein
MKNEPEEYSLRLLIWNSQEDPLRVVLEPWGERYWLLPKDKYTIVFRGLTAGLPEIEWADESIVVFYAWVNSVVSVFHGETELSPKRDFTLGE